MKFSIIYHSESGNTSKIADIIAEGIQEVDNCEAKCMSIDCIDEEFVNESDAVLIGSPTYMGTYSWQIKKWLDTTSLKLENKLGAVFATENFLGGGADVGLISLIGNMLVRGMLIYSGGARHGQPYTHFGVVCRKDGDEFEQGRAKIFGARIAEKTVELF